MIPKTDDGRVLFAVPWHNKVVVGTTDIQKETAAFYVTAGFLLGDNYSYNSSTAYINRPKAGSYEFLLRYDNTDLNDIDGTYF